MTGVCVCVCDTRRGKVIISLIIPVIGVASGSVSLFLFQPNGWLIGPMEKSSKMVR